MTAPVLLRRKSDCKLFIEVERVQHVYSEPVPAARWNPALSALPGDFIATAIERVVMQEMAWMKPDTWSLLASSIMVDADNLERDFERIVVPVQTPVIQQASAMPRLSGEVDGR